MSGRPPVYVDNTNMIHLCMGVIEKLGFLGKINDTEDDSSGLAGFEIHKLLVEQERRENEYAHLIKQRSLLKGIENKKEYNIIQTKISDVAGALKESTKKLCRLFKENTNVDDDTIKVRKERELLLNHLNDFTQNIQSNTFESLIEMISKELDSQNKLPEYIEKEKKLAADIKAIKTELHMENSVYQNEIAEKNTTISHLKEDLSKAKAESKIKMSYDKKEIKTKQNTQKRLAKQNQEDITNQTKACERLRLREIDVFEKISTFLTGEEERVKKEAEEWNNKLDENRENMDKQNLQIKADTEKCQERYQKLQDLFDAEKKLQEDEDDRINNIMGAKEAEKIKQKKIDDAIMLIQKEFETWLSIIGPSKKPKGMKKK
jgi:chromosome segregation ATPase